MNEDSLTQVLAFLLVAAIVAAWLKMALLVREHDRKLSELKEEPLADKLSFTPGSDWQASDMQNLKGFLAGLTGRKLVSRLRATELALGTKGALDVMHTAHSAGITVGYGQCVTHLESLANACAKPVETEPQTVPATDEEILEELSVRYSP